MGVATPGKRGSVLNKGRPLPRSAFVFRGRTIRFVHPTPNSLSMDTLFDLDDFTSKGDTSVSLSPISTTPLGRELSARATRAMQSRSDAIARWSVATPLAANSALLSAPFFDPHSSTELRVANTIVLNGVVQALRVTEQSEAEGERGRTVLFSEPRVDANGIIVDSTGDQIVPHSLMPGDADAVENGGYYIGGSTELLTLIAKKGPFGLFRPVMNRNYSCDCVHLLSELIEIPARLIPICTPEISSDTENRLWELHRARLSKQVAEIVAMPIDNTRIAAAGAFLRALLPRHRVIVHLGRDTFHERERDIIAPLTSMFEWAFTTADGVRVEVSIDTSYGWRYDVILRLTDDTGAATEHQVDLLANDTPAVLSWFDESQRTATATGTLESIRARKPAATCSPNDTEEPHSPRRNKARRTNEANELTAAQTRLNETARALSRLSLSSEQAAVIERCVSATNLTSTTAVEDAIREVTSIIPALRAEMDHRAKAFLAQSIWSETTLADVLAHRDAARAINGIEFVYSDDERDLSEFVRCIEHKSTVREVAPGYWISIGFDGALHGAVSSSGFYSVTGRDSESKEWDNDALVRHVLEMNPRRSDRLRAHLRNLGFEPSPQLTEWIKALPLDPDSNGITRALEWIASFHQTAAICASLAQAIGVVENPESPPSEVNRLRDALTSQHVRDDNTLRLAVMASALIDHRFGPRTRTAAQEADDALLVGDDASDDDSDEPPDSEE